MSIGTIEQKVELAWAFERVVHKYNLYERKTRDYGTGQRLTHNEIHALAVIDENEGLSLGELARRRGVTKGAMSQLMARLSSKGLAFKKTSPVSEAQVALYLTEEGRAACEGHSAYHRKMGATVDDRLLGEMTERDYRVILNGFLRFEELLDDELGAGEP